MAAVEAGLTAKRIHQDLRERGFAGGYSAAKLFVSRLRLTAELPHRRMECEPGGGEAVRFWPGCLGRHRRPAATAASVPGGALALAQRLQRSRLATGYRDGDPRPGERLPAFGGVPATIVPDYVPRNIIGLLCPTALCSLNACC